MEQAEWICSEVERLTREHPELKEKLEEWCEVSESEKKEFSELIDRILAEAEEVKRERKAWVDKKLKEACVKRLHLNLRQKRAKCGDFEKIGEEDV